MTLFEDGDWRLVDGMVDESSIMHRCGSQDWWFYVRNGFCNSCDVSVPDKMMGLQSLHNWDR